MTGVGGGSEGWLSEVLQTFKKKRLMSQDWMEGQSVLSQRRGMLASVHGIV